MSPLSCVSSEARVVGHDHVFCHSKTCEMEWFPSPGVETEGNKGDGFPHFLGTNEGCGQVSPSPGVKTGMNEGCGGVLVVAYP